MEIPDAISLIPLEIPYPQPRCLFFFWNSTVSYLSHWYRNQEINKAANHLQSQAIVLPWTVVSQKGLLMV